VNMSGTSDGGESCVRRRLCPCSNQWMHEFLTNLNMLKSSVQLHDQHIQYECLHFAFVFHLVYIDWSFLSWLILPPYC